MRHAVKGSVISALPIGKGKRFPNTNSLVDAAIGGWQTSVTFDAHSGQPFTVITSNNNSFSRAVGAGASQYPNVIGDPRLSNPTIHTWYNAAAFAQPAPGTFGNQGRNSLAGPALSEVNFSLATTFTIPEVSRLQSHT